MAESDPLPKAMLITRNLPPLVGGMERLIWHIVDELRTEYEVHVVGPEGCSQHLPPRVDASEIVLRPLWRFLLAGLWTSIIRALRDRPKLVFAGSGLTAPLAWLAARLSGGKCVVYLHGLDIETRHLGYRLLWHPFLRRCDRVIANSRFTHSLALGVGIPIERLQILHPGVALPDLQDAGRLRTQFRTKHELGEAPLMLYVGRITLRKGLLPFVEEILPQVIQTIPSARLLVIGDEPASALLAEQGLLDRIRNSLRSSGLEQQVIFLGELPVDDPQIRAAYFAADVLVFPVQDRPGDNEGFGMVAVEAAAHGLPTVAFAVGGVSDAVAEGRSGNLVEAGNNGLFAKRLCEMLETTDGSSYAETTRDHAIRFAWSTFGEDLRRITNKASCA